MNEAKIPKQWEIIPLQEVATFRSGGTPSKANGSYWNGDIPWVSAKDLKTFYLRDSLDRITEDGANNGTRLVPAGTILILVRGMTLLKDVPLGVTTRPMTFNQDVRALSVHERFDPHFIAYSLLSRKAQLMSLVNVAGHGTGRLATELLETIPLRVPKALPEQQKIAAILSTWDRAIELTGKLIAAKQKRKKALMQQLLTGKRRLPGFTHSWRECKLGTLFSERKESGFDSLPLLSITATQGVVDRETVERKDTSNADKSRYLRICPGDIGYNTMRMWQGVSAVSSLEGIVSPAYTILKPSPDVDVTFMGYLLKFKPVVNRFWRYSQGLVDDTLNLKFSSFKKIKVFIPDVREQQAISTVLQSSDREVQLLKRRVDALKRQKRGLMQQLLTGKTRVKV